MGKFRSIAVAAALISVSAVSSSYAIFGVGFHWGFDFSMSMEDNAKDGISIPMSGPEAVLDMSSLPSDVLGNINSSLADLGLEPILTDPITSPKDIDFARISRENFRSHILNFGGKLYVDCIPFIDAIEASVNFGVWQYEGAVSYLDVTDPNILLVTDGDYSKFYKSLPVTLEEYDMAYFGLTGTPYAKLQLDATIRKNVFALPANLLRVYAGAGMSVNFTTPILSSHLLDGIQTDKDFTPERMVAELTDPNSEIGKEIVEKILEELMTPRYGMHIIVGTHLKLPVVPISFYADGKLMIPFSKFDENGEVKGVGVAFYVGIALGL
jgi:hypothetical protein